MRAGIFLFGSVEMDAIGHDATAPTARRYGQADFVHAQEQMLECGVLADQLGFDSFWLTEHHFQYEGYEVIPNGILFGAVLAERTRRIRIGTMFNIVGQWHPLRLAEDFATMHNLSGGRGILGVGRGTVPREMLPLSEGRASVGSADNPDQASADEINRAFTDEALEVIVAALSQETFSHRGRFFQLPPSGIPDRGAETTELTLIPRPVYPYETWQAVTSPPTLAAVPKRGFGAVFWLQNHANLRRLWETYGELYEEHHGVALLKGERRMLVCNTHVADSHEAALAAARPGHDEFWRFLGPYGWGRGYRTPDGKPAGADYRPTLEDSIEQRVWLVGTAEEVAEGISRYVDDVGLENITFFPSMPGEPYASTKEQLHRLAFEVLPLLADRSISVAELSS